ncbi:hypothetical protein AB0L85_12690 [Streptomyces sp. NPDC052051]|uniref:hypothetical protein n=1 Tax=Streptomyces sp. NPDC052051 TaxID=3154649 RepID=UPI00344233C2
MTRAKKAVVTVAVAAAAALGTSVPAFANSHITGTPVTTDVDTNNVHITGTPVTTDNAHAT